MTRYLCGPSRLRLDGRIDQVIQPGSEFEAEFSPAHEARLLKSGAIRLAPAPPPTEPIPADPSVPQQDKE